MVYTSNQSAESATIPEAPANIVVVGVGGGGCNAALHMIQEKEVPGVKYICANTDIKSLDRVKKKATIIQIGQKLTHGLGAGGIPRVGAEAGESSREEFARALGNPDLVFITAGMGGGTGTGAAPVLAATARESGALVIGVVTTPFSFEGGRRLETAIAGIDSLKSSVDNLIVIHNDRLFKLFKQDVPMEEALKLSDHAVMLGVLSVAELVNLPGEINVDLADVKNIMKIPGRALMAIGEGKGPNAALEAAKIAVNNPLLDISIEGAQGVLFNVNGGPSLRLGDVNTTGEFISGKVDSNAIVFFGMVNSPDMYDTVRITVIATGIPDFEAPSFTPKSEERPAESNLPPFLRNFRR